MSMIINRFVNSFVFWAAWIIIPVIMEIIPSIGSIVVLIKKKIKPVKYDIPIIYPEISLLIPVYNSQDSLEACISSIYESDYPNEEVSGTYDAVVKCKAGKVKSFKSCFI